MGNFKVSRKDREWFAEICGELLVKVFNKNISEVFDAAEARYAYLDPPPSRAEIHKVFRTANPNTVQYSASTYDPHYERGAEKNNLENAEYHGNRVLGYLEIHRQVKLKEVREAIANAFTTGKITTIDDNGRISSIDAKLLDIFDKDNGLLKDRNESRSNGRDGDGKLNEFDSAIKRARRDAGSDGGQKG